MKVFELADELGVRSADVLDLADAHGVAVESGADELTDEQAVRLRGAHEFGIAAAEHLTQAGAPPEMYAGAPSGPGMPPPPGMYAGAPSGPGMAPPPGMYAGAPSGPGMAPPPGMYAGAPSSPGMAPPAMYAGAPGSHGGPAVAPAPVIYFGPGTPPPPPAAHGQEQPHTIFLAPGQAPPPGYVLEGQQQVRPIGMHPLVKSSLWYLLAGHVTPCLGLFFMIRAYQRAGQGRLAVQWSRGRYSGAGAAQAVQIYFWIYLALTVLAVVLMYGGGGDTTPPPP